ncbi:MAG: T9SS type A sorting domain-containing protein [Bacteroidetes bacterium]|nr:T9SS type A sorting domain-containing protein [Bacteroidota bacterium]
MFVINQNFYQNQLLESSALTPGIYILKIIHDNQIQNNKIIKI